jgi:hypothetical protein
MYKRSHLVSHTNTRPPESILYTTTPTDEVTWYRIEARINDSLSRGAHAVAVLVKELFHLVYLDRSDVQKSLGVAYKHEAT